MFNSGGNYGNGTNAGVGYSNGNWTNRGNVNSNVGWRSALPPYARYRSAHGRPGSAGGIKDLVPALYNERKRKTAVMAPRGVPCAWVMFCGSRTTGPSGSRIQRNLHHCKKI